jgi:N-methylhydantoinase B
MFRGGLALVRQYRFLEREASLQIRADRTRFPAYGLAGGQPGRLCRNVLDEGEGPRVLPSKTFLTIHQGAVLRHELAGAGGWGDPFRRDPERVFADVRNQKISVAHAREAYGVVVTDDGSKIDLEATQRLRDGYSATRVS